MAPPPARFIALEGVDGCGKTTQARHLAAALGAVCTHEPGGTALGVALRTLLLHGELPAPVPKAEALLMAADRAQHVAEVVRPALAGGTWVVSDRFSGSTLAYQGFGRGLAVEELRGVVEWAADGVTPDLSVLIDVPLDLARRRLGLDAPDRLERLDAAFFDRVRQGYLALASREPDRWVVVDGAPSVEEVATAVMEAVSGRLGRPSRPGTDAAGMDR